MTNAFHSFLSFFDVSLTPPTYPYSFTSFPFFSSFSNTIHLLLPFHLQHRNSFTMYHSHHGTSHRPPCPLACPDFLMRSFCECPKSAFLQKQNHFFFPFSIFISSLFCSRSFFRTATNCSFSPLIEAEISLLVVKQ